jgi:hypothetical protein
VTNVEKDFVYHSGGSPAPHGVQGESRNPGPEELYPDKYGLIIKLGMTEKTDINCHVRLLHLVCFLLLSGTILMNTIKNKFPTL